MIYGGIQIFMCLGWLWLIAAETTYDIGTPFVSHCLPETTQPMRRYMPNNESPIVIQHSSDILSKITSRIYAIYLQEVLGYMDINMKFISVNENDNDRDKLFNTLENLVIIRIPTINLGIWMPSNYHMSPHDIQMAGPMGPTGRYGWFIPKTLVTTGDLPSLYPYTIFSELNTADIRQFVMDPTILSHISHMVEPNCPMCNDQHRFIPKHCRHVECALLLAPSYAETSFVVNQIMEFNLFVNVMWFGDNLKTVVNYLEATYETRLNNQTISKKFMFLYRIPSEIVYDARRYEMITMPRCEEFNSSIDTLCFYESTPLLKYYSKEVKAEAVLSSLWRIQFNDTDIYTIFEQYDTLTSIPHRTTAGPSNSIFDLAIDGHLLRNKFTVDELENIYDKIVCDWMLANSDVYMKWYTNLDSKMDIYIGGIFPIQGAAGATYSGLVPAAKMAEEAINRNASLLPNVHLNLLTFDGQCKPDNVMNAFIQIFMRSARVIGILGPACSETVEPIAGLSKHVKMAIISYSAEGATFTDRKAYPYFFRTIGENRQYEHVYIQLLQQMQWNRVAALTEDGQKYTEYISHMETAMKEHRIELISNKKFPRYLTPEEMRRNLVDLKRKNTFIIIADIYDEVAQIVMCEAFKLQMTAKHGYVWFLPVWLSKTWKHSTSRMGVNVSCSESQILEMLHGHFSLSHAPFASENDTMQENITVADWRSKYHKKLIDHKISTGSEYAGFAYDAVWVYAYALDRMLKEDESYLANLHSEKTTNRLVNLIEATDFSGVSGRIRFGEGASRFSVIQVLQWINGTANLVGSFKPNISTAENARNRKLIGGQLELNHSRIVWLWKEGRPTDGTISCGVESLANMLNTDCANAAYILITIVCLIVVIAVSLASFMFWKRQYDKKLKRSAKVMRNFGIDLLSPSSIPNNTLDKWEVSKDRVVINRRLGEGAFGTVYGGEAQLCIGDSSWTAVAVKTLKVGSNTEDRLDFLSEAEAMKRFDHRNIVKLLGVCLQTEPIYTIMEFMLYGDLKTFLLARRHLVGEKITEESDVHPKRLTIMALDVSRALSYLADNKYVHRDIACRNCLVNAQRVIKLGDFGMARPMFENDYYKFNRKGMLPVRWMAPESLGLGIFTPGSDVWSFGVLLYEIITFGSFPFQGLTNNQVLDHIKNGNTLTIPSGVKPHLEGLMKACWNSQYKNRPTASEISEFISNYPRLVTPCLDVPLSSVQMPESDSDQMELLPGCRRRVVSKHELTSSSNLNNLDENASTLPNGIMLNDFNVLPDMDNCNCGSNACNTNAAGYTPVSNTYNPIEPLLRQNEENSSRCSKSLRRYVPMGRFKRNNRSITFEAPSVTSAL